VVGSCEYSDEPSSGSGDTELRTTPAWFHNDRKLPFNKPIFKTPRKEQ
jgi:hypothetical protein